MSEDNELSAILVDNDYCIISEDDEGCITQCSGQEGVKRIIKG